MLLVGCSKPITFSYIYIFIINLLAYRKNHPIILLTDCVQASTDSHRAKQT